MKPTTALHDEAIKRMFKLGLTYVEIAEKLGLAAVDIRGRGRVLRLERETKQPTPDDSSLAALLGKWT